MKRHQFRRDEPMPPDTIYVGRPGPWGNKYKIGDVVIHIDSVARAVPDRETAVKLHSDWLNLMLEQDPKFLVPLKGKNLACWCKLCPAHFGGKPVGVECPNCQPCHCDTLLRAANK